MDAPNPASAPQANYSAPAATSSGMEENLAGALCYVLGLVTGIIFLVLEPYNKKPFVRFHAFQAIFFHVGWIALYIVISILSVMLSMMHLGIVSLVLFPIQLLLGFAGLALWIFCMYKAYNREWFQLPIVGPLALKQSGASQ